MAIETPTWIYKSKGDKQTASEMNQLAQSVIMNATELSNIKDDVAELSNKTYNPEAYSGMGRVILRKNIVNGVNVLTQGMINQSNTIYEIRYDFTLTSDVTIPENCILEFDGGSVRGEHTITGTNTGINASLVKIFNTDVTLAGTWNITEAYPEWFGAKGDGVNNDTLALQNAIFCSKKVVGYGTYLIGTPNIKWSNSIIINKPISICLNKIIDARTFSNIYSSYDSGVFYIQSDNVTIKASFENINDLPVDDKNSNNLSDVGGYAIIMTDIYTNINIDVKITKMNGVKAALRNSNIKIEANICAYPYASSYSCSSIIYINCNHIHRAWFGCCDFCNVTIKAKNYHSTGNSGHVLINSIKINGIIHHCTDSVFHITDTGTEVYNTGASYINIDNQYVDTITTVNITFYLYGDISNTDNAIFHFIGPNDTTGITLGDVNIINYMKKDTSSFNRHYNAVNLNFISYVPVGKTVIDVPLNEQTKKFYDLKLYIKGTTQIDNVEINNLGGMSRLYLESLYAVVHNTNYSYTPDSYDSCVLVNIENPNTKSFYRCKVLSTTDYIDGTRTNFNTYVSYGNNRPINTSVGCLFYDSSIKKVICNSGYRWVDFNGYTATKNAGDTLERPTSTLNNTDIGFNYFDKTLNKPIWWTGSTWVDATGVTV